MYILDTNAFYYAAGISKCTYDIKKLQKFISENEIFISSTSLFEFFTKYRHDIDIIHEGGRYIYNNHIKIASNVINPLPDYFDGDFRNITNNEFEKMFAYVLDNKIDVESRYCSLLFDMCLMSGYYFSAYSDGSEPSEFSYQVLLKVSEMFLLFNLDFFSDFFKEGYNSEDCENYVKKCFYDLLSFELEMGLPYIEQAKATNNGTVIQNIDDWIPIETYDEYTKKISKKIHRKHTSNAYLKSLALNFKKNNSDDKLYDYILEIKKIFDKKVELTALQEYFYDTLVDIITKGAALCKNDFLDALIMCNIQDLHVLITYDNGVIKRMEKRKKEHPKYLESIDLIRWLKN